MNMLTILALCLSYFVAATFALLEKGPEFYFSGVNTFAHLDHYKW